MFALAAGLALSLLAAPASAGLFSSDPVPPGSISGDQVQMAQAANPAQQSVRIGNLEEEVRQLNGRLDELTHQIQVLQNLLQRSQEDTEFRFNQLEGGKSGGKRSEAAPVTAPMTAPVATAAATATASTPVMAPTTDVSDAAAPPADGVGAPPQLLGTIAGAPGSDAGAPSQSALGGPLDLSALARGETPDAPAVDTDGDYQNGEAVSGPVDSGPLPPPPRLGSTSTATVTASAAPAPAPAAASASTVASDPASAYDNAYSRIVSGDYAGAEQSFKAFLATYPKDAQAANARYWLGESYYARQKYRDAASAFLSAYKDYPKSTKAPDSLLKLGLSLEGLGETSAACATYGELTKKYPKASSAVLGKVTTQKTKLGCP